LSQPIQRRARLPGILDGVRYGFGRGLNTGCDRLNGFLGLLELARSVLWFVCAIHLRSLHDFEPIGSASEGSGLAERIPSPSRCAFVELPFLIVVFREAPDAIYFSRESPTAWKTIAMSFEPDHALSLDDFSRRSALPMLLLAMTVAVIGMPTRASDVGDASMSQQQPSTESREQKDEVPQTKKDAGPALSIPSTAPSLCDTLAATAMTNDLPADFFTRLIWQESRFKPDAVSPKGAQGIAQFMPETARSSGLEDPFNPLEAIAKSGQLLRSLRREFGNVGLAAAAYNAGSGRVRGWLGGIRPLPQETRAYVWLVTGRSVEDWAGNHADLVGVPPAGLVPCNPSATSSIVPHPETSPPKPEIVKPWGVEVVGGPTPAKALASYREWQPKYAAIIADRELHVVIRGIIGQMGAARVRVSEDTQAGARKLCAALKAAGAYCDVMRN